MKENSSFEKHRRLRKPKKAKAAEHDLFRGVPECIEVGDWVVEWWQSFHILIYILWYWRQTMLATASIRSVITTCQIISIIAFDNSTVNGRHSSDTFRGGCERDFARVQRPVSPAPEKRLLRNRYLNYECCLGRRMRTVLYFCSPQNLT